MRSSGFTAVLLSFGLLACAGQAEVRGQAKTSTAAKAPASEPAPSASGDEATPGVDAALSSMPVTAVEASGPPAASGSLGKDPVAGVIDRAGLVAIIDHGLGRFLQHMRLEPVLENKRFLGFRVGALDPAWGEIGLVPGDVITRVNNQSIERPEQAMQVFESLRTADQVCVDLRREGVPATLCYRIE